MGPAAATASATASRHADTASDQGARRLFTPPRLIIYPFIHTTTFGHPSIHSHHHVWSSVHSFTTPRLVVICPFIHTTTFGGHLSIHSHHHVWWSSVRSFTPGARAACSTPHRKPFTTRLKNTTRIHLVYLRLTASRTSSTRANDPSGRFRVYV